MEFGQLNFYMFFCPQLTQEENSSSLVMRNSLRFEFRQKKIFSSPLKLGPHSGL